MGVALGGIPQRTHIWFLSAEPVQAFGSLKLLGRSAKSQPTRFQTHQQPAPLGRGDADLVRT